MLRSLRPSEIPAHYPVYLGVYTNLVVAVLGGVLIADLFLHGPAI